MSSAPARPRQLREAHAHIAQLGRSMAMIDLGGCASGDAMLAAIESAAPDANGWILAHSARPESWPVGTDGRRWPVLSDLDRAAGGCPCVCWCFDYHALLASTAAMRAAGIAPGTCIPNGSVEVDRAGSPTGVLLEHAALRAWGAVPEPGQADRLAHVRTALAHLAGLGYTEVCDLKAQLWLPGVLTELEHEGTLACSVELWPLVPDLEAMARERGSFESDRIRLGGGKVFVDGTLNSRTAWMLEPYADVADTEASRGMAMMTAAELDAALRVCEGQGLPMAAHAIGDGAVRAVLDAVERVRPAACGQRIEHAELVDDRDVRRFVELGVVCSVQPCHLLADIEALRRAVPNRLGRVLPLRELIDAGLEPGLGLIFGSDVPIVRADPGDSILAATKRRRADMAEADAIAPEQAITEDEAWACFGGNARSPS